MQRIMTSTALVFAGALLLAGCAAGGGTATPSADPCETLQSEVRDISNGAQNVLAAGGDPADVQGSLEEYAERVDTLLEDADEAVTADLEAFHESLHEAAEFAATLPTDPEAEVDAEAVAEQQTAIQEAATGVNEACAAE